MISVDARLLPDQVPASLFFLESFQRLYRLKLLTRSARSPSRLGNAGISKNNPFIAASDDSLLGDAYLSASP